MPGKVTLLLLAFPLLFSFRNSPPDTKREEIIHLYRNADKLFNLPDPTHSTDSMALSGFEKVIIELEKFPSGAWDSLLFQSWLKKGILLDIKNDFVGAKNSYLKAISIQKTDRGMHDSLLFRVYIYAGTSYFNLNIFDSASYLLLKAESLSERYPDLSQKERLYMTLGALYYENGNYLQSKNSFTRALEIIETKQPFDMVMAVNAENNLAISLYRLGLYQEALLIFRKLLKQKVSSNYVYLNMGRTLVALNKYSKALEYFRKVSPTELPGVLNEMAHAQLQLPRPDSAQYFLDRLMLFNKITTLNSLDLGINQLYRADWLISRKQYLEALPFLQKAAILFSGNFKNPDLHHNPSDFVGTFTSYTLFEALSKKAMTLELIYRQQPKEEYLLDALAAYNSTLSLLRYIERCYDTDDAKIFLKKKSEDVYQGALLVCLELFRLHPEGNYLEQAFQIGEKNKASVITASLKEKSFSSNPGTMAVLLQKERNIKYNIARLNIKTDQVADSKELESRQREKSRYEIELSQLQKGLEQNNYYYKLKYDDSYPGIKELQQHIANSQALISFYASRKKLHVFVLTQEAFQYTCLDSLPEMQRDIELWLNLLKTTEAGKKFNGIDLGRNLYQKLVKPIQTLIPGKKEWIIIPDGILYFLPFESLPSGEDSKYLLQTTEISYHFSSRFITTKKNQETADVLPYKVLAFAPFAGKLEEFGQQGFPSWDPLPASRDEIAGLGGRQYLDSTATKEAFLKEINKYPVVHLATHAVSDISNSASSFIAFYPQKKSRPEDCLFLEELYGMNMDATKLVIISACETGRGELVNNEGVISLARAFAYAGCSSTINSLWKADDKATSFILRKFHQYLQKGYTKSKALQQAKIDYISSDAVNTSPNYWAHLVLMGSSEPIGRKNEMNKWGTLLFSLCIITITVVIWRKKTKKKSTLL